MGNNWRVIRNIMPVTGAVILILLICACSSQKRPELVDDVALTIKVSPDSNPNDKGLANPVRITIYQLRQSELFSTSDYFTLKDASDSEMNGQIQQYYDAIFLPGEEKNLNIKINNDITALGVVTAYRNIAHSGWKVVYLLPEKPGETWYQKISPIKKEGGPDKIVLNIERLSTSIKKMD
ncbi:type VI secretion system lipoprotein TssJ [Enterobacteriaceae bacterium LUAb1]